jgi:adenylosuccinate synthase
MVSVLGNERGATTGRGRSVGFLDIPWLLYAIRINHPKYIALTRFDMLSGITEIPVVTEYKFKNQILPPGKIPPSWELDEVEVVKEIWPCWQENITGRQREEDLPMAARDFVRRLEGHLKVPILFVGTGPKREAVIVRL